MPSVPFKRSCRVVGRYSMYDQIASGGMASVHFGRLVSAVGFSRTVAIKHLHPNYSSDAAFVSMFVDEARLAARIQHPNVTVPLDVVLEDSGEIFLVMEYVHGETLARLIGQARTTTLKIPFSVSASIVNGALHGLHAAHEAVDEQGAPLSIVHRDISPQNILVGADGIARVLDFGVAKAVSRFQSTQQGQLKGKLSYMAPEQLRSGPIDRRVDIFAAGIVFWEALTHKRLFRADDPATAVAMVLGEPIIPPSVLNSEVPLALDQVVMKALDRDVQARFQTAREFADAIEDAIALASPRKVGEWVQRLCSERLLLRAETIADIERSACIPDSHEGQQSRSADRAVAPLGAGAAEATFEDASLGRERVSTAGRGEIVPLSPLNARTSSLSRITKVFIASAAVLAVLVGVGIVRLSRKAAPATPQERLAPSTVSPPSQMPAPASPVPTFPSEPEPSPGLAEPTAPSARSSDGAEVESTPAPRPEAKHGPKAASRRAGTSKIAPVRLQRVARPAASPDCDPPYYFDSEGIRRVKASCL